MHVTLAKWRLVLDVRDHSVKWEKLKIGDLDGLKAQNVGYKDGKGVQNEIKPK